MFSDSSRMRCYPVSADFSPVSELLHFLEQNETLLAWSGGVVVVVSLGTIVLTPLLMVRIPPDYFSRPASQEVSQSLFTKMLRFLFLLARNVVGLMLLCIGVILLFLPGQGVLTIFAAVVVMDFPGKRRLESWIVSRKPVWSVVSALRKKCHRPQLIPPREVSLFRLRRDS